MGICVACGMGGTIGNAGSMLLPPSGTDETAAPLGPEDEAGLRRGRLVAPCRVLPDSHDSSSRNSSSNSMRFCSRALSSACASASARAALAFASTCSRLSLSCSSKSALRRLTELVADNSVPPGSEDPEVGPCSSVLDTTSATKPGLESLEVDVNVKFVEVSGEGVVFAIVVTCEQSSRSLDVGTHS